MWRCLGVSKFVELSDEFWALLSLIILSLIYINSFSSDSADSAVTDSADSAVTDSSFYLESIGDSLHFLDCDFAEDIFSEGVKVTRPAWMRRGNHVQILATGSLYLVGGILSLVDPDLDGTLSDG